MTITVADMRRRLHLLQSKRELWCGRDKNSIYDERIVRVRRWLALHGENPDAPVDPNDPIVRLHDRQYEVFREFDERSEMRTSEEEN